MMRYSTGVRMIRYGAVIGVQKPSMTWLKRSYQCRRGEAFGDHAAACSTKHNLVAQAALAEHEHASDCEDITGVVIGPSRNQDELDDVLRKMCPIARGFMPSIGSNSHQVAVISGSGVQLGLDSTWRFSVASNGAFREEIKTNKFTSISGFDGRSESLSWSGDHTGLSQHLELDDHELLLLVNWVRSGLWASPILRHMLHIDLLAMSTDDGNETATVRLRLVGGRVNGMMAIDLATLQPIHIEFDLRSDSESLRFLDWKNWPIHSGIIRHPGRINYETMSGTNILRVEDVTVDTLHPAGSAVESSLLLQSFSIPQSVPLALDTEFNQEIHELPAWVTNSGHVLVKAIIDGKHDGGYWLFDTGASGSVIDSAAAESLNLHKFGSFRVKGMAGDLDGTFRECKSLELGPLKVKEMLMMEMDCSGLVRGAPGPIYGIIGCDIMSRAVFDIPQIVRPDKSDEEDESGLSNPAAAIAFSTLESKRTRHSSLPVRGNRQIKITMYDPRTDVTIPDPAKWMAVRWVSSLPHLEVGCTTGTAQEKILFMIDSGAGGMQLMMNGLTSDRLELLSSPKRTKGTRTVRGVGGSSGSNIRLTSTTVDQIRLGDNTIENVDCLVAADGVQGGVELSHYTGGVLCNDILVRYRFVVDLPRDRLALI